ncbi:MAG: hypothetical protein K6B17_06040, partial [Treponema sp.]|nr:hypothetical protein [Treponema sp.]
MFFKRILKKIKLFVILVQKIRFFFDICKKKSINKHFNSNTIVHLMFNDKFLKPYVVFLNKYFDSKKHIVLCKRWFDKYPFPEGENVYELESYNYIDFSRVKKIVCHSVFDNELVDIFYHKKELLNKTCCIVWGGDYTCRSNEERQPKDFFVLSNFNQYICGVDEPIIRKMYNISEDKLFFKDASYIFPLNKTVLDNLTCIKKDYIQIQLGQSVQESILDSMDLLYKFKDENIRIVVILSYGGNGVLENEIIKKGCSLFGNKFIHIDNYMSPED